MQYAAWVVFPTLAVALLSGACPSNEFHNHLRKLPSLSTEHDHYHFAYISWEDQKRIFSLILHFDIKDGKIWIQYNGTETAIAQVLTDRGIPASDTMLGFHSPFKRQFSGYAVT